MLHGFQMESAGESAAAGGRRVHAAGYHDTSSFVTSACQVARLPPGAARPFKLTRSRASGRESGSLRRAWSDEAGTVTVFKAFNGCSDG